jgi:hypothetical protein
MLGFALLSPTYDVALSKGSSTLSSTRHLVKNQAMDGRSGVSNSSPLARVRTHPATQRT